MAYLRGMGARVPPPPIRCIYILNIIIYILIHCFMNSKPMFIINSMPIKLYCLICMYHQYSTYRHSYFILCFRGVLCFLSIHHYRRILWGLWILLFVQFIPDDRIISYKKKKKIHFLTNRTSIFETF